MQDNNMKSMLEREIEKGIRDAFDRTPVLLLEEQATIMRDVTVRVCDEYIQKGREIKQAWAMEIVGGMLNLNKEDA